MKKSIKLKYGEELKTLLKHPEELSLLIEIAFNQSEETGETESGVIDIGSKAFQNLVFWKLAGSNENKAFLTNKKVVDITLRKNPSREEMNKRKLSEGGFILDQKESEYLEITKAFQKLFKANLESIGARTVNVDNATFEKWVTPIRLMIEVDQVTVDQLREVYVFLQNHVFWRDKVQSTEKLRAKFQTIHSQIKSNGREKTSDKTGTKYGGVSEDYLKGVVDKIQSNSGS